MFHKCYGCKYESTHQEMGFRPFGVCTKKSNLAEAEKAYNAEVCPYDKDIKHKDATWEDVVEIFKKLNKELSKYCD